MCLQDVMAQLRQLEDEDEDGEKPPEEPQEEVIEEDDYEIKTPGSRLDIFYFLPPYIVICLWHYLYSP